MRLEAAVLRTHLRRSQPSLFVLSRFIEADRREGLEALLIFLHILNHSVASAGSRDEALQTIGTLENLFGNAATRIPLIDQPQFDRAIDAYPDFGLAWEAWCSLEEMFSVPRSTALDVIAGLRFDIEGRRPETLEALLKYVFLSGGVLGAAVSRILALETSFTQAAVDVASSARLMTLTRNYRQDLERGRNRLPVDSENINLLSASANILYRAFESSLLKISFKHQVLLSVALVLHREHKRPWYRKLDQVIDSILKISGRKLLSLFARPSAKDPSVDGIAVYGFDVDPVITLKNQSLKLSRDSGAMLKSKPRNDHTPDKPSTFR